MKFRIYFRPELPTFLLGITSALLWWGANGLGPGLPGVLLAVAATFYTLLTCLCLWSLLRIARLERWYRWDEPLRLLILAPHEDDCAIAAGGIGARNRRLGGQTRIVYLAPDELPGMAERRAEEARAAWRLAGVPDEDIVHVDLLPPFRHRDPERLKQAATALRVAVDSYRPQVIIVPMFEGGHVHHDMTAALVAEMRTTADRFEVFEAPEYGPYVSLLDTPHRIIALCTRWLLGLVSYFGPPDGVDGRTIRKYRLDAVDLACKRAMLGCFESQNAPSLVATKAYPDRLVVQDGRILREPPFHFRGSYLAFVLRLRRALPPALVDRLLPVQLGTIGRERGVTNWKDERGGTP